MEVGRQPGQVALSKDRGGVSADGHNAALLKGVVDIQLVLQLVAGDCSLHKQKRRWEQQQHKGRVGPCKSVIQVGRAQRQEHQQQLLLLVQQCCNSAELLQSIAEGTTGDCEPAVCREGNVVKREVVT